MYALGFRRDFIARHKLIGGDWGPENDPHSHHYVLELQLHAHDLDAHGYLVDLTDVEAQLARSLGRFRDRMLNDLPEFAGLNPSLENFARILADALSKGLQQKTITQLRVILWENESAWASYALDRISPGS